MRRETNACYLFSEHAATCLAQGWLLGNDIETDQILGKVFTDLFLAFAINMLFASSDSFLACFFAVIAKVKGKAEP